MPVTGGSFGRLVRVRILPVVGMMLVWTLLSYQGLLGLLIPPTRFEWGVHIGGLVIFPFLIALALFSVTGLWHWERACGLLRSAPFVLPVAALFGSFGTALLKLTPLNLASTPGYFIVSSLFAAVGFLACMIMWIGYIAIDFCIEKALAVFASFVLSMVFPFVRWILDSAAGSDLGPFAMLASGVAWWWSVQPDGGRVREACLGKEEGFSARDLVGSPLVVAYAVLLLAGSFVRGIADIGPSTVPEARFAVLACLSVALLLCAVIFFRRRCGTAVSECGNDRVFFLPEGLGRFGMYCWAVLEILFVAGMLVYLMRVQMAYGLYVALAARSLALPLLFVCLAAHVGQKSVNWLPLALVWGPLLWVVCWLVSYALLPLLVVAPSAEDLPPYGSTKVIAVVLFMLGVAAVVMLSAAALSARRVPMRANAEPVCGDVEVGATSPPAPSGPLAEGDISKCSHPENNCIFNILVNDYGLTYREAKLARLFASGYSLNRAANELGVTKGTAQGYIKSIYRKTGVHRKDDLVDLLNG